MPQSTGRQVQALLRKNIKIHMRTSGCPCRIEGGCACFNACTLHIMMPIVFTVLVTALPWLLVKATAKNPDKFLDIETKFPYVFKVWRDAEGHQLFPPTAFRNYTDYSYIQSTWGEELPLHSGLFGRRVEVDVDGDGDCEFKIESCFCQTLAIVADEDSFQTFKAFLELEYQKYLSLHYDGDPSLALQDPFFDQQDERWWCMQEACMVDSAEYSRPIFRRFSSESEVDDWVDSSRYGQYDRQRSDTSSIDRLCGAIIFHNNPRSSARPKITIRGNVTFVEDEFVQTSLTKGSFDHSRRNLDIFDWYYRSNFLSIQYFAQMFLAEDRGVPEGNPVYTVPQWIPMPTTEEREWGFGMIVTTVIRNPIIMCIMFGPIVASIAFYVARERQTRQRELMRMMGLSDSSLLLSWLVMFIAINFFMTFVIAIIMAIFFYRSTSILITWMAFFLTACASTTMGLVVAALVTTDRTAAMIAFGFFAASSFTYIGFADFTPRSTKLASSLFPSVAFVLTLETLYLWETLGIDNGFDNMYDQRLNYSVGDGLGFLFLDFCLYLAVYYYLDQVVPWHAVGVPRRPWFLVLPSYWREILGRPPVLEGLAGEGQRKVVPQEVQSTYRQAEDEEHLKKMVADGRCISVSGLHKSFSNAQGEKVHAVNNVSLTMYQDECFCLLGHNGAGKTTTMMMITGCMVPTAGHIMVKGHRVPEEIRAVRSSMGFCPQHNVLFDELTCQEHLDLFGRINGMDKDRLQQRGQELMRAVSLVDKLHARANRLSGGMQRKLSSALAFLHEPYLVILDEPSAGLDPYARRGMWDTFKRWRAGHILCLTTHYMDEADALGDRITIMSSGRVACSGTGVFLKNAFGCGYILTFVKTQEGSAVDMAILEFVNRSLSSSTAAEVQSAIGKELILQVPFVEAKAFPDLFRALDENLAALHIETYGTSVANLEEVFLKVAKLSEDDRKAVARANSKQKTAPAGNDEATEKLQHASFGLQLFALLMRRVKYTMRNRYGVILTCVLPLSCVLFFCAIIAATMVFALPSLWLGPWDWNVDVDSGPKSPVTIGAGNPLSPLVNIGSTTEAAIWQGATDRVYFEDRTWVNYPGEFAEEGEFVQKCYNNRDLNEASQYGCAYYPRESTVKGSIHHGGDQEASGTNEATPRWRPVLMPNLTAFHSHATMFQLHADQHMRSALPAESFDGFEIHNHPFQLTEQERDDEGIGIGIVLALVMMIAFGFIPAGVTSFIVMEKEQEVKIQLLISGCSYSAYWLSNFIFDSLYAVIPGVGCIIIFALFQNNGTDTFVSSPGLEASLALFIAYGPAMSMLAFVCSFYFSKAGVALFVTWIFNIAFGVVSTVTVIILGFIKGAYSTMVFLRWIFRLVPVFPLGYGHMIISVLQREAKQRNVGALSGLGVGGTSCDPGEPGKTSDDLCTHMVGDEFLMLWVSTLLLGVIVIALDAFQNMPRFKLSRALTNMANFPPAEAPKDTNVAAEMERVKALDPSAQFVYVKDVHKVYNAKVHAVRGISFAASEGQVFGLLGVNGAGKTSTFKILCGQEAPSAGEVRVHGYDVTMQAVEARKHIGYCPQFNALLTSLTVVEHLYLFGRLKGLFGEKLKTAVDTSLGDLDLQGYVNSRAGQLSGGNKRKVSVGMAVIGEPPMVFLDEPSAGMDPVARRGMWSVIQDIAEKRRKSVVILTTHSMEEAEALCSRIAIQVDGQFRCLGSSQQLKSNYGLGLELNVRLKTPTREEIQSGIERMGLSAEQAIDVPQASKVVRDCYGAEVIDELVTRPGSPVSFQAMALATPAVLAEWAILIQRTHELERFMATELGSVLTSASDQMVAVPIEKAQNVIRYQIKPGVLTGKFKSIGSMFALFQDNSGRLHIDDFQVCQTSLEQIFNHFAGTQQSQIDSGRGAGKPVLAASKASSSTATSPEPVVVGKQLEVEQPEANNGIDVQTAP